MIYRSESGQHIEMAAAKAIDLARRYNRRVVLDFRGLRVVVSKRMSVRHVARTWSGLVRSRWRRRLARFAKLSKNGGGLVYLWPEHFFPEHPMCRCWVDPEVLRGVASIDG